MAGTRLERCYLTRGNQSISVSITMADGRYGVWRIICIGNYILMNLFRKIVA